MKKYKVEKTDDGKYKLVKKDTTPFAKKTDKDIASDALKERMASMAKGKHLTVPQE